ncbi:hypothetical protein [Streptomyces tirandamycinicus]|uniref:Gram-positive cocci surface proteins LPxTG domain-containing protein n=1 Tax=Streptomyces tirandamycinicus TaxID=2174846 RepID=A0A2S1SRE7_9ACTN|nr:hypothetical protein [Streptomyces tirandamycinicus]AWI28965.1 hypothetical protein DDW44_09360 [Streptomyces tirandamycinicus]
MRSVTIALRVVGAATGFLILAPVPATAFAEENAQLTDTVQALGAESGSEVRDGGQSGVVDRLQIVTLTPPSRSDADDKQGEEENAERGREGRDGKKDEGSQDGKKDREGQDGKKDREGQDGKKDRDGQGRDGREDGSDEDHGHDGDHDDGSDDGSDDDHDDHDGEDGEDGSDEDDAGAPDPAESPVAPVRAGGGGAADRLASQEAKSADTQGPGTPHTVIGLLLAGAAAVAVACRSARRRRLGSPDRD